MKLFRKDRAKSRESPSTAPQPPSPKSIKRDDQKDRDNRGGSVGNNRELPRTSSSRSIPLRRDTASTPVATANNSPIDSKKHNIRIGDTRFFGRVLFRAKALYDYPIDGDTLQIEDEEIKLLRFKRNDIINVYEQDASGWWAGEHNGDKGIFPGSYMKIIEEEVEHRKSKDLSKDELVRKITELEKGRDTMYSEREKIKHDCERERFEFERRITESKHKGEGEVILLKKALKEKQEIIDNQVIKIKELEYDLEESITKLSTKEVEVMTMEMEVKEYKKKIPEWNSMKGEQDTKIKRLQEEKEVKANLLKDIDAELLSKRSELQDVVKLRQEIEKGLHDAQSKLVDLENPQEGPKERRTKDLEKQVELFKKQLGEEVFERKKLENELRDLRATLGGSDVESIKKDKIRLEAELKKKSEADAKLSKINLILQGILQKDESQLSVAVLKDILTKMKRGIANPTSSEDNSSSRAPSPSPSPSSSPSPSGAIPRTRTATFKT